MMYARTGWVSQLGSRQNMYALSPLLKYFGLQQVVSSTLSLKIERVKIAREGADNLLVQNKT